MNFYKVLEIEKGAEEADIKKAYRRLSKIHHPDLSTGDEQKFIQIKEAFETLSDPDKRIVYDQEQGGSGSGNTEFRAGQKSDIFSKVFKGRSDINEKLRGQNRTAKLPITFLEASTGVTKNITIRITAECESCEGTGKTEKPDVCTTCSGTKRVKSTTTNPMGYSSTTTRLCLDCKDWVDEAGECDDCRGLGKKRVPLTVEVVVPSGISNEGKIKVNGCGEPGKNGGESGDLIVTILVEEDETFRRDGDNLHTEIPVKFWQLTLGDTVEVPTVDGGTRQIDLPVGTPPNTKITIKGAGLKDPSSIRNGDLIIELKLTIPNQLTEEQTSLLKQLDI